MRIHMEEDAGKTIHDEPGPRTALWITTAPGSRFSRSSSMPDLTSSGRGGSLSEGTPPDPHVPRYLRREHGRRLFPVRCQRLGQAAGVARIRHPHGDQEHEFLQERAEGTRLRDRHGISASSTPAAQSWCRKHGSGTLQRARPCPCAPRRKATITAISPSLTSYPWRSMRPGSSGSGRSCRSCPRI